MKSKKFVALALSASIALSAAYVATAAVSKETPSVEAASQKVNTTLEYRDRYTTSIKINNKGGSSGTDFYNLYYDRMFNNGDNYGNESYLTFKALKRMLSDSGKALPSYKNTSIEEFKGWAYTYDDASCTLDSLNVYGTGEFLGEPLKDSSPVYTMGKQTITIKEWYDEWDIKKSENIEMANLHTVYVGFANDEVADAAAAAVAAEEEEKAETNNRNGQLDRRLWRNYSGNNVKYWWMDTVKDENGEVKKDATGATIYEKKEGVKTAWPRAVLLTNSEGKFTSANYSKNKDADGGHDTEGHTYQRMTELIYNAALKAARVQDPEHDIALVYDVHWSTEDYIMGLIDGKQAQVKLRVTNYDVTSYVPYVYHIVYGENGYKRQKVENLDIGKHDVTFYAKDFSPYVLVLVPKDRVSTGSEYDNPPTGDASALPVALLAAASLSATGAVVMRRKRELGE